MNNQGLEALAALASAAPASTTANRTEGGGDSKNANIEENRDTTSGGDSTPAIAMDGSVAATAANLSAAAQLVASLQQQNQAATPPQPTLQPQQHVHPINLAAAAAQSQFNNAAAAAASSASPELAFLQQLQRTTTPAADQNMAVMMQNLAYYQLLLHNQAQQQQEVQNLPSTLATLLAMNQGGNVTGHTASHTLLTRPSSSPETDVPAPSSTASAPVSQHQQIVLPQTQQPPSIAEKQQQQQHGHLLYGNTNATSKTKAAAPTTQPTPGSSSSNRVVITNTTATNMPPPPLSAPSSPEAAPPITVSRTNGQLPSFPRGATSAPHPQPGTSSSAASSHHSLNPHTSSSNSTGGGGGQRESEDEECDSSYHADDKKELKRAANRRSAQLSRKRKKQFVEELKDENDELRRKEQILKSIPDLVVVFDSTGKLWFVSHSISRFVTFEAIDLEGKSFWDRLCPESVRLLKAAFMDSLAARESHTDTVPLGDGLWDLRLVDKDGSLISVTLNGVVHFAGERPECVCCIRPKDGGTSSFPCASSPSALRKAQEIERHQHHDEASRAKGAPSRHHRHHHHHHKGVLVSDISSANTSIKSATPVTASKDSVSEKAESLGASTGAVQGILAAAAAMGGNRVIVGGGGPLAASGASGRVANGAVGQGVSAIRISDSGNSSGESESGSSDELNATN